MSSQASDPVRILLVEDNPADVNLAREALAEMRVANVVDVVTNGDAALDYLHGRGEYEGTPLPDLVLLDLNLPRTDGREVLAEIKSSDRTRATPVIALTTSISEEDVSRAYSDSVNAYVQKPLDFGRFVEAVRSIEEFWFSAVELPNRVQPT